MGYREDQIIDKYNLDIEWMNQSKLFTDWGEQMVFAEERVDKAKAKIELVKAQLDSSIRIENKDNKISENFITNAIILQKDYQDAITEHIEAKKQRGILEIAYKSFEFQRSKALDRLTDLFLSNYWSEPRGKADNIAKNKEENSHLETLKNNPRLMRRRQENI